MITSAYTRGTMLWLDDNFLDPEFLGEQTDLASWQKTFGETDHRIYRLLNLDLEPVTSLAGIREVVDDYCQGDDKEDRFMMAVVDLSVPAESPSPDLLPENYTPQHEPRMSNGILAAELLTEAGIPFVFLSSSSENSHELSLSGLERIPYFKKIRNGRGAVMPSEAARFILEEYRSNISWLDIKPIVQRFGCLAGMSDMASKFALSYFPFFGAHRDFAERWELKSEFAGATNRIALRTPRAHSEEFILQCVSLIADSQPRLRHRIIVYLDSKTLRESDLNRISDAPEKYILVLRLHGDQQLRARAESGSRISEKELIRTCLSRFQRCQTVFIIPPDESADALLFELAAVPGIYHDDLPVTRLHDKLAREELLRRTSRFVLQKMLVEHGKSNARVGSTYLAHPELLVEPVHWAFLLEATQVAEEISDPFEVSMEFCRSLDDFLEREESADASTAGEALEKGKPLPIGSLLKIGDAIFEAQEEFHPVWVTRALVTWLSKSWRTPYDLVPETNPHILAWSKHSLDVACQLAERFIEVRQTHERLLENYFSADVLNNLLQASTFLLNPAVAKLIAGQDDIDWFGFESLRWPHGAFPVPSALNRMLRDVGGRYFFPHRNELDMATLMTDGQSALSRLEARASFYKERIEWTKSIITGLPLGWREPVSYLLSLILDRSFGNQLEADNEEFWKNVTCLQRNALRVSYIFNSLAKFKKDNDHKAIEKDIKDLRNAKGAGLLLGRIRGRRASSVSHYFVPNSTLMTEQRDALWEGLDGLNYLLLSEQADMSQSSMVRSLLQDFLTKFQSQRGSELSVEQTIFDILYSPEFTVGYEAADALEQDKIEAESKYFYRSMRSIGADLVMSFAQAGSGLNHFLRPIVFADGYHYLSLVGDLRNNYKDVTPTLTPKVRAQLLELFLLGIEGLVLNLKWLLMAAGELKLASTLPEGWFKLRSHLESPLDYANEFLRVEKVRNEVYSVYTLGNPGALAGKLSFSRITSEGLELEVL